MLICMAPRSARDVTDLTEAISREIRAERARQRLSQREVYEAAGISRSTYVRIEGASRGIDVEQLIRICDAFGVATSDLVRRAEDSLESATHAPVIEGRFRQMGSSRDFPETAVAHYSEVSIFDEQDQSGETP